MNAMPHTEKKCYDRSSSGMLYGISFALPGENRLLAPYACLSHVEMSGGDEVAFIYNFGVIRVKGRALENLYDAAHKHELRAVWCCEANSEMTVARVEDIVFKKREDDDF